MFNSLHEQIRLEQLLDVLQGRRFFYYQVHSAVYSRFLYDGRVVPREADNDSLEVAWYLDLMRMEGVVASFQLSDLLHHLRACEFGHLKVREDKAHVVQMLLVNFKPLGTICRYNDFSIRAVESAKTKAH